jgi:hypothetical protein
MNYRLLVLTFAVLGVFAIPSVRSNMVGTSVAASQVGSSTITGRVIYTDGRPVSRYPIPYRPLIDSAGRAVDSPIQDQVRTDGNGRYVISGLANGVYFVGFFHPDRLPPDLNSDIESLPDSPGFADIGVPQGKRVIVANDQPVSGIDFVMTDVGPETVEGVETGAGDLGLPQSGQAANSRSTNWQALILAGFAVFGVSLFAVAAWVVAHRRREA